MAEYFRYFPKVSGGRMNWVDGSESSIILNNEFFGLSVNAETQVGDLTLTGLSPTVLLPVITNPLVGNLILTGVSPTAQASDNKTAFPQTGQLNLIGLAPSVLIPVFVYPQAGNLILTGVSPSVLITDNQVFYPLSGALLLTGYPPTFETTFNGQGSPPTADLFIVSFAPAMKARAFFKPNIVNGNILLESVNDVEGTITRTQENRVNSTIIVVTETIMQ